MAHRAPYYYTSPTQVEFIDPGETCDGMVTWIGGIAYEDKIICGCCGGLLETSEIWDFYLDEIKDNDLYKGITTPIKDHREWENISGVILRAIDDD